MTKQFSPPEDNNPTSIIDVDNPPFYGTTNNNHPLESSDTNIPAVDIGGSEIGGGGINDKGGYGGSGNNEPGSSSGDDSIPTEAELAAILSKYGCTSETLAPEILTLTTKQLNEYLRVSQNTFVKFMNRVLPSWRRRVAADPTFPFKLLMEETVGLALSASGMIAARGKNIWNELDFAFCDIAVGASVNFALVWLLSPVIPLGGATAAATTSSGIIAGLPANVFAYGNYGLGPRIGSLFYKGLLFGICGFAASMVGTTLSQGLVKAREMFGKDASGKKLPNVLATSAAWAVYMALSSNPRYQTLAGFERVMFATAPEAVAKISSGAARTLNNVAGGAIWVWWAKYLGIQSTEEVKVATS